MQLILYSDHALWLMGIAGCILGIIIGALLPVAFAHLRPQRDPETRLEWPPLYGLK
jgi:predicted PurR-regulated permease PerM